MNYYYYNCDGYNDIGWGCVYRNLQTLISFINYKYNLNYNIPSINILLLFFNKQNIINKQKLWIEPYHVGLWFNNYKEKFTYKHILYVKSDRSIENILYTPIEIYTLNNNKIINNLEELKHIINNINIPLIIDNGTYSYILENIDINNNIILIDPHTTKLKNIKIKKNYYNFFNNYDCWMIIQIIKKYY